MMSIQRAIVAQLAQVTNAMLNRHTDNYITTVKTNNIVYYLYDEIGNRPVEGPVPLHGALVVSPYVSGAYAPVDSFVSHTYTLPHVQFCLAGIPNDDDEYDPALDTTITAGED